jgi:hypothetical protein
MKKLPQVALLAAALAGTSAAATAGEECKDMMGKVEAMISKSNPDKADGEPAKCAAFGEFTGMYKMFRIISDECLPDGEKRFRGLADLDRQLRNVTTEVDKKCK